MASIENLNVFGILILAGLTIAALFLFTVALPYILIGALLIYLYVKVKKWISTIKERRGSSTGAEKVNMAMNEDEIFDLTNKTIIDVEYEEL